MKVIEESEAKNYKCPASMSYKWGTKNCDGPIV